MKVISTGSQPDFISFVCNGEVLFKRDLKEEMW